MRKLFTTLLAVAFLAAGSLAAVAADNKGPAEIKFDAKLGAVTFKHAAHQGKISDCKTCHHKGVEAGKCTACHGVDPKAPGTKDAFHKSCKTCHEQKGAPSGCKDCHKK